MRLEYATIILKNGERKIEKVISSDGNSYQTEHYNFERDCGCFRSRNDEVSSVSLFIRESEIPASFGEIRTEPMEETSIEEVIEKQVEEEKIEEERELVEIKSVEQEMEEKRELENNKEKEEVKKVGILGKIKNLFKRNEKKQG